MCYVARLDAVKRAGLGLLETLLDLLEERVMHRSARHTYGALDDFDILLASVDVALFEGLGCVALLGCDEARTHLHRVSSQRHNVMNIFARIDAAAGNHGYVTTVLLANLASCSNHLRHNCFERIVGVVDLLVRVT